MDVVCAGRSRSQRRERGLLSKGAPRVELILLLVVRLAQFIEGVPDHPTRASVREHR